MAQPIEGSLRVWWVRNPPASATFYPVRNPREGADKLRELTEADLHNLAVVSNGGGMDVFEGGDWTEWYDSQGRDVDEAFDLEN